VDPVFLDQLQHLQQILLKTKDTSNESKSSVKFDKKLLDFDYGEEEDDDVVVTNSPNTTTSANTQHNAISTNSSLESLGLLLTNPEVFIIYRISEISYITTNFYIYTIHYHYVLFLKVLRQLQTLQQTMQNNASSSQHEMEEKMRKLQQMKQQEEEFDKHLAQTVPVSYTDYS